MAKVLEGSAIPPQMAQLDYLKQLIDFPEDHAHLKFENIVRADFTPSSARRGEFVLTSAKGATLRLACDEEETAMLERTLSLLMQTSEPKKDISDAGSVRVENVAEAINQSLPHYDDANLKFLAKACKVLAYVLIALSALVALVGIVTFPMLLLVGLQGAILALGLFVVHALLTMLMAWKQESRIRTQEAIIQSALMREWVNQSKN